MDGRDSTVEAVTPQVEPPHKRVEVIQWEPFQHMFLSEHKQGEHISVVGPTGSGKSRVALELAKLVGTRRARNGRPSSVVIVGTKPRDETLSALHRQGWPIVTRWPPAYGEEHCIVWPRGGKSTGERAIRQRAVISPLLDVIYQEGGQTVMIDEAAYFERPQPKGLGLSPTMEQFWSEARSSKITLIAATQRPRHVTLLMWSEPSWVFIFRPDDIEDLKRVAGASGRKNDVLTLAPQLGGYEFLCVRRQRNGGRGLYVSKVT